jgi:hypothetical protein
MAAAPIPVISRAEIIPGAIGVKRRAATIVHHVGVAPARRVDVIDMPVVRRVIDVRWT